MGNDYTLEFLVELDNLEVGNFALDERRTVLFHQVAGRAESLEAFVTFKTYRSAFLEHLAYGSLVGSANGESLLINIPRVFGSLLVAQGQAARLGIEFQHHYVQLVADFAEFRRMFDFLGPRKVGYVHQSVDAFFQFNEYTEVGEIANRTGLLGADRIFFRDIGPRIGGKLLHTEGHLALVAVQSQYYGLNLIADLDKILCGTKVGRPRHFRYVNESFNTRHNFYACAVVSQNANLALRFRTGHPKDEPEAASDRAVCVFCLRRNPR